MASILSLQSLTHWSTGILKHWVNSRQKDVIHFRKGKESKQKKKVVGINCCLKYLLESSEKHIKLPERAWVGAIYMCLAVIQVSHRIVKDSKAEQNINKPGGFQQRLKCFFTIEKMLVFFKHFVQLLGKQIQWFKNMRCQRFILCSWFWKHEAKHPRWYMKH